MSYQSFKRVLGETKLELKSLILFGTCLLVVIAGSFYWYGSRTEQQINKQNRFMARGLVRSIIATYHWQQLDPSIPFRKVVPQISEEMEQEKYSASFIRPNFTEDSTEPQDTDRQPTGPKPRGAQDEFERQLLDEFSRIVASSEGNKDAPPPSRDRRSPENEYQYYQPIFATKSCIACHNAYRGSSEALGGVQTAIREPVELGDLIAVIQIVIPDKETQTDLAWNNAILWATAIVTVFISVLAMYFIIRYIVVKPLKHLRDVSDEISHGNTNLRADIHTGDEFEELGNAFNRMLRHLVDAQDKMREVNADLDAKVDELAQVNMQLYEMNRLKSDFLATMSHELRTPLNSIIGFSDVLESIASLDDKQKRYVQNIQKSGRVLLDMINDILDLAKIESGKMEVRPSDFRVENVTSAQCDMARPLTERKNIDLDMEVAPGLPELYQDQGKVQQILNNLLSNAIKFTPEGGRIVVSAARNDHGELLLTVADTGVGIAEEEQTAIFEKFRQGTVLSGGDAMTREYSGTGLGLSIVKELCKLLGGSISLESQLGRGSTFTVRIPWTRRASQPKLDTSAETVRDDLLRPRRADLRRDQPVSADYDI